MKKNRVTVISAVVVGLLITALFVRIYQRYIVMTDVTFENPPLTNTVINDNFYANQLTPKEAGIYETIKSRIESFNGGIIEFDSPLTGREFMRIGSCIIYHNYNYFYASIPCIIDAQDNMFEEKDILSITEPVIKKCFLFLSCSEFKESIIGKDGNKIVNLAECEKKLSTNSTEKIQEIVEKIYLTDQMLQKVVDELPDGSGQRDALKYFCDWIETNVTYDHENLAKYMVKEKSSDELFEMYYTPSTTSCIIEGKAMCVGFSKLVKYFCNQVGIEAHLVCGNVGSDYGHAVTAVKIGKKTAYIDLSNVIYMRGAKWKSKLALLEMMSPKNFFEYEFQKD